MLKAVIFDFDGVVVDSEQIHYEALNEAFASYGVSVSKEDHWAKYLGYSDIENIEAVSEDYGMGWTKEMIEKIAAEKLAIFDELASKQAAKSKGLGLKFTKLPPPGAS